MRTAESGNMQCSYTDSKKLNVSSVTALTNLNITTNSHGVVRQTRSLTLLDSRPRRANYVLTHSSVPIVKAIIKWIQTCTSSGSITSIAIGTTKNNKNFIKVEATLFAWP